MHLGSALLLAFATVLLGADDDAALTLLQKSCLSCHNGSQKMGGLNLQSRDAALRGGKHGPALDAANPPASLLWKKVEAGQMPLGNPLPAAGRTVLRQWLEAGAPWTRTLTSTTRPRGDKSWWSLQPLTRTTPPDTPGCPEAWSRTPIDRFLYQALAAKRLQPSPPADRRTLIRRVTFDLTGLPPTPGEVDAFEKDPSPTAYEALVDRLLASPAYGERWGRHWLDVARFGESHGYEQNHLRPNAWPYRDYIIRSFNQDKPFDRLVLEQLAGDVVAPGNPDVEVATAFLVAGPHDTVTNLSEAAARQQRADDLDDIITATAQGFLGLTVNCARCHDHKYDPILQADYYRLQAVFSGVQHKDREIVTAAERQAWDAKAQPLEDALKQARADLDKLRAAAKPRADAIREKTLAAYRPPVDPRLTEESFTPTRARHIRLSAPSGASGGLDEIEAFTPGKVNVAVGAPVHASSTRRAENNPDAYSEKNLTDGKFDQRWFPDGSQAVAITIDLPAPAVLTRIAWSSDRAGGNTGRFAASIIRDYTLELSLDGKTWRKVAGSEGRLPPKAEDQDQLVLLAAYTPAEKHTDIQLRARIKSLEASLKDLGKLPTVYAGRFQQPELPAYLLKGGNVMARDVEIAPAGLSTLDRLFPPFELPVNAPEADRRLALARWIIDARNPLTPRVLANRLWHYHFGRGLAGTPSDFGFNGEKPSHPELLDYLAARLIHYGWQLKPLHKEILLSAAYRQSSAQNAANAQIDTESRYLWRFPPQRLDAEAIRDGLLAVSGKLDRRISGPGFRLYKYTVDNVATYFPLEKFGEDTYRRAVYYQSARSIRPELLAQYDCPDSSLPEPRRVVTTSPLQALSLLNNSFILDMSAAFAGRLRKEAGPELDPQIRRAFALAFSRLPEAAELDAARALAQSHGMAAVCRALFNANEFVYVM